MGIRLLAKLVGWGPVGWRTLRRRPFVRSPKGRADNPQEEPWAELGDRCYGQRSSNVKGKYDLPENDEDQYRNQQGADFPDIGANDEVRAHGPAGFRRQNAGNPTVFEPLAFASDRAPDTAQRATGTDR